MASGTSDAFPFPYPIHPFSSPTTTRTLKLNRRPPLTTLATRLIWTTLSFSVISSGLIFLKNPSSSYLKLQTAFAGPVCQHLYIALILVAAPVKANRCDALLDRPLPDQHTNL